ncbi:MAG: pimeloyl-ACP methyl ester carboxylesterase [Candidatus Paceibacteria bacterium]|jgi:pimeloyl-ACP methyl ester carboxylesterase
MNGLALSVVLALALLNAGCGSFRSLDRDLERLDEYCEVRVTIADAEDHESAHVVLLVDASTKIVKALSLHFGKDELVLHVPQGNYFLGAFEDQNENLRRDENEPVTIYGEPTQISLRSGAAPVELQLVLGEPGTRLTAEVESLIESIRSSSAKITHQSLARVATLDDDRFAPSVGQQGMWEPATFIEDGYHGLYMLQEYDPARTPIVFVHGIGGTPRDFVGMIASIDSTKFQAWVFYYPSALRLADLGQYLLKSVDLMLAEHGVEEFFLVAHSMGGLVSTEAVQRAATSPSAKGLGLFVTIASPLGGMASAEYGVDWSPTVMPCWYDLTPGSQFLRNLYRKDIDPLAYYMAFAYERSGFGGESSDGTVPLSSQLRDEAQARARGVIGVNSDHVGVLSDPHTLAWINGLFLQHLSD